MGNQLVNSMVRGFGLTLGRKAANSITSPRTQTVVVEQPSFSKKQQELIKTYEDIIRDVRNTEASAEQFYKAGTITESEYKILKAQIKNQLDEANTELEKIKSVSVKTGRPIWKTLVYAIIILYAIAWTVKAIKGL